MYVEGKGLKMDEAVSKRTKVPRKLLHSFACTGCLLCALLCAGCLPSKASTTISLPTNPSTGYEWVYTMDKDDVLVYVKDEYRANTVLGMPDRMGEGGMQTYVFQAEGEGTVTIDFSYVRPWDKSARPAATASYTYTIDNGRLTLDARGEDFS